MIVGLCRLTLRIPGSRSLKEKRAVIQSLQARLRSRFNVSVAEVDRQDAHQVAVLAVAAVAGNGAPLESLFQEVERVAASGAEAEVLDAEVEWLR